MSSTPERQSSFDDVVEITGAISFPVIVSEKFTGRTPTVTVARAFRIDGGGSVTVMTAAGQSRTLTAIEDPYFVELKITRITAAASATKIRLFA